MRIVILGLSITSSWGNGHATTYRGLVRELVRRGHDVLFLERDVPWYADNRDLPNPPYGRTALYSDLAELERRFEDDIREADLVVVGSYVPDGVELIRRVQEWASGVVAFYDIDTPVTLAKLEREDYEYLSPDIIPGFDVYLTFTGGKTLTTLKKKWGAQRAEPLYCSVDETVHKPIDVPIQWDLGYLGTYSADRQPPLEELLLKPARDGKGRYVVAGPQFPLGIDWPDNCDRIDHLPPRQHCRFYNAQRFTLNVTRADMIKAGYAPSVRLFEAAACGTPIISDWWEGLDTFFEPEKEIIIARDADDVRRALWELDNFRRRDIGDAARTRVLSQHTAAHRAAELEAYANRIVAEKERRSNTDRRRHARL